MANTSSPTIAIIVPYFGQWPEWFNLYLESCKHNPSIDWHFFTDCDIPNSPPANTIFHPLHFDEYKHRVRTKLQIEFNPQSPYKLCDLKPALGFIHSDIIAKYDFWGFGDIDIIYGDIRHFYTDDLLKSYNTFSTHWDRVSGHLFLLRNQKLFNEAFMKIPSWQSLLSDEKHHGIDESKFSKIFLRHKKYPGWLRNIYRLKDSYQRKAYFKEQYSTILSPKPWLDGNVNHPTEWRWENGRLTNTYDHNREFMYLHFMNFKSSVWLPSARGSKAAWEGLEKINFVQNGLENKGFTISPKGFNPLIHN